MITKKSPLVALFVALLLVGSGVSAETEKSGHGWGLNVHNHRFQTIEKSTLNTANVGELKLKWVYGLNTSAQRSYPLVFGDVLYIGDGPALTAIELASGVALWSFETDSDVTTAITHANVEGEDRLFFSARTDGVYSISADEPRLIWRGRTNLRRTASYTGSPLPIGDQLFVPSASTEIGLAMIPFFGCCTDTGAVGALDIRTGETNWFLRTIQEPAKPVGYGFLLVRRFAPSGAPVWGAPTYDEKRDSIYFGTGQNYSLPASKTSDAIFSVDATSGEINWVTQFTENDAYNLGCSFGPQHWNCPDPPGPDVDFGAPAILYTTPSGQEILLAGQKSSDLHAINPDDGSVLWTRNFGRGGLLGGVHHGMAVNPRLNLVYVPIFDIVTDLERFMMEANPGLHAVDIDTGEVRWSAKHETACSERNCWPGISVAPIANDSLVVVGTIGGELLVYDAATGELLWSYKTHQPFDTVDEDSSAHGGAFDVAGALLYKDMLIVTSGYSSFEQLGGNALLVFGLDND